MKNTNPFSESARCKVFKHDFDGHIFLETIKNSTRWVARLQCTRCGTRRVDVMIPLTCELVSRHYEYPDTYDTQLEHSDAKRVLFKFMIQEEGNN
jgi:hypothetical protein